MYNSIICRYHEIATKGNNRNMFERCLVDNIAHLLREVGVCRVHRVRGRIWVNRVDGGAFSAAEMEKLYKMARYRKLCLLLLEPRAGTILPGEQVRLFDEDLCELTLDSGP